MPLGCVIFGKRIKACDALACGRLLSPGASRSSGFEIMQPNGPPVELVSVAERQEAVAEKLLCYDQSAGTQPQGAKHDVVFAIMVQVL